MHRENPFCMVKPVARALLLHEKRHATCLLRIVARRHTLEKRAMQPNMLLLPGAHMLRLCIVSGEHNQFVMNLSSGCHIHR